MTADEIREQIAESSKTLRRGAVDQEGENYQLNAWLGEIAAQLAELNQNLNRLTFNDNGHLVVRTTIHGDLGPK